VEPGRKYFVNVGAVGQPRDNNPKAAYVVYDMDEGSIELRRLDYDIPAAQKKIIDAGLPPRLAERLASSWAAVMMCRSAKKFPPPRRIRS
jgi:diadenosine tetraphosphatase ApaH/serine/threonine PP2A family protein phosphatase